MYKVIFAFAKRENKDKKFYYLDFSTQNSPVYQFYQFNAVIDRMQRIAYVAPKSAPKVNPRLAR